MLLLHTQQPRLAPTLCTARAAVGFGLLGFAAAAAARRSIALAAAWSGASHVVAACTAYSGCPELGAIASLVLRRPLRTWCGPWQLADRGIEAVEAAVRTTTARD